MKAITLFTPASLSFTTRSVLRMGLVVVVVVFLAILHITVLFTVKAFLHFLFLLLSPLHCLFCFTPLSFLSFVV